MGIVKPIQYKVGKYSEKVMQNMMKKSGASEEVVQKGSEYMNKALADGVKDGKDVDTVISYMQDGFTSAFTEHGGLDKSQALDIWEKNDLENYARKAFEGASRKYQKMGSIKSGAEVKIPAYDNPRNAAPWQVYRGNDKPSLSGNIKNNNQDIAYTINEPEKVEQISGGSYDNIRAKLLKEHEGDNGWKHSLGRKKQEFENFNSEMALAYKSGDVEQVASVGRNYGIEIDPKSVDFGNSNYMSAYEEHFIKKLEADPTMWDKAMGNKIPHKVIGTGIGGGAVLALANSRGQRSNAELYGV